MIKLIHIVEKFFNSGGATSLQQIYSAMSGSSLVRDQEVLCVKNNSVNIDKKVSDLFPANSKYISSYDFNQKISCGEYNDAVFVFHKLMCSPTKRYYEIIKKSRRPFFCISHTYTDSVNFNKLFNFPVCVAVSDHMNRKISSLNKRTKIFTIRNIVDHNFTLSFPGDLKDESIFKTGRINSLNSIKYSDDFVKWVCSMSFDKTHIHEYVGTGEYYGKACEISRRLSNAKSSCIMTGSINNIKSKFAKLKSWDVFLYDINRPEGTSMSVLESLACGVPVICSNLPGNNELIQNGINGYVFNNFSDAYNILKNLAKDSSAMRNLSKSTEIWAKQNLTKEILMSKYEEVIQYTIDNYGKVDSSKYSRIKFYEKENTLTQKKISFKKVVQQKFIQKKSKKDYIKKYPEYNRNKKISGVSVINNRKIKEKNIIDKPIRWSFVPLVKLNNLSSFDAFYSDYIGVCNSENCTSLYHDKINLSQSTSSSAVVFNVNNLNVRNIAISDGLFIDNDEILFITNSVFKENKYSINKKNG